jgi:transposase
VEVSAALPTIVRREDGRTYREMLTQMAKESGIDTPECGRSGLARPRPQAQEALERRVDEQDRSRIAEMKDGRTHLAYKPEHPVDLDTGVIIAAALHPADGGDTTTIDNQIRAFLWPHLQSPSQCRLRD